MDVGITKTGHAMRALFWLIITEGAEPRLSKVPLFTQADHVPALVLQAGIQDAVRDS